MFSDKLRMIFIELPNFTKTEDECTDTIDKWLYILKHMETLERMPFESQRIIFSKLASVADIDRMEEPMRTQYEDALKTYRDNRSVLRAARLEGEARGRAAGRAEGEARGEAREREKMVRAMLDATLLTIAQISEISGMSPEEILAL